LEVSRREVNAIIENTRDYFWSVDNRYQVVYANKPFRGAYLELFGKKIRPGNNILEPMSKHEVKFWKKKYDSSLLGNQETFEQSYLIRGKEFYFEVNLNPVLGRDKSISGITCFARDITIRKSNEEKIKHQAQDLTIINKMNAAVNQGWSSRKIMGLFSRETAKVFQSMGASVYLLSEDQNYLVPVKFAFSNKIIEDLRNLVGSSQKEIMIYRRPSGYFDRVLKSGKVTLANSPELLRKLIADFLPPGISSKFAGSILKFLKFKAILSIPLFSEGGELGILGMAKNTDITEDEINRLIKISEQVSLILQRVKNIEKINENEIKFRGLFEGANDAIFILEKNKFTGCNQKTLELFQCSEEEVIQKSPVDLSPLKQPDGSFSKDKARSKIKMAEKGLSVRFDWVHKRPNGSLFSCEVSLSKVIAGPNSYIQAIVRDISARKKSERQLKESEEKFKSLFMKSHMGMIHRDIKTGKIELNDAFIKLFGYTRLELEKIEIPKLTHPGDRLETIKTFERLVSGKIDNLTMEKKYIKKDGETIWGFTGGSSIKNNSGEVLHVVISIMDITREKTAEIQAQQKTDDLMIINQLNLKANQNVPLDDIISYFSNQLQTQFFPGYFILLSWDPVREFFVFRSVPLEESLRKTLFQIVGGTIKGYEVKPGENNLFSKMFHHKRPWLVNTPDDVDKLMEAILKSDNLYLRRDEIIKILNIQAALNFTLLVGNEIIGHAILTSSVGIKSGFLERLGFIMEQFTGILRRKLAEEEGSKLNTIIEQLAETVVITDTVGNIQYVNPAFEQSSGYLVNEVIGLTPAIFKSGKQDRAFYDTLWNTILSGKTWSNKLINRKKTGELYEENITITPIRDENGVIVNFVAVKKDITRESLLEEQLRQSQKLETIGTLAGGIAHDFNNILGTLIGYNEMVREELPEKSKAIEYSRNMNDTMLRAKSLVNQILTFSRKMEPERRAIHLSGLLEDSIKLFRPAITPRIKLSISICRHCPKIKVDPSQIQQLFMNLLTNAHQALESNEGEIKVKLNLIDNSEEKKTIYPNLNTPKLIEFSVYDNGPGISKDVKDRIFEPFFTTKPVGKGTGLGLSVVHGIVQAHKGTILVDSEWGKFTCFTVYFPVH